MSPPGPLTRAQPNMAKMKRSAPTLTWAMPETTSARTKLLVGMFRCGDVWNRVNLSVRIVFWCVRIPTHHVHPSSKNFRVPSFWNIPRSREPWRHLKRSGLSIWLQRSVLVLWHRALQCCKILHPATPQWKGQHIRAAQQMLIAKGRNISTFATCGWLCSWLNGFKLQPNAKDQKDQASHFGCWGTTLVPGSCNQIQG